MYRIKNLAFTALLILTSTLFIACGQPSEQPSETGESKTESASKKTADSRPETAPLRSPEAIARDVYRHPQETLAFFEVEPHHHVIELWPGGGWYTDILGPMLKDEGKLIAASFVPDSGPEYRQRIHKKYLAHLAEHRDALGEITVVSLGAPDHFNLAPENSVDRVLTFRNSHNWIKEGIDRQIYEAAYKALKPGGIFGVVQHRAEAGADPEQRAKTGYVPEPYVISTAESVGFRLVDKSEINANPKDIKAWPEGVWTLPPAYRLGDKDREKYAAIGESDRMTLKFVKPE